MTERLAFEIQANLLVLAVGATWLLLNIDVSVSMVLGWARETRARTDVKRAAGDTVAAPASAWLARQKVLAVDVSQIDEG